MLCTALIKGTMQKYKGENMKFSLLPTIALITTSLVVQQPAFSQQKNMTPQDIEKARESIDQFQNGSREEYVKGELLIKFKKNVHMNYSVKAKLEAAIGKGRSINSLKHVGKGQLKSRGSDKAISSRLNNWVHIKLNKGLDEEKILEKLRRHPLIDIVEYNYIYTINQIPNDPDFSSLWGLHNVGQNSGTNDADIDAPEAWDKQTGSNSTVVAVIDTGVDYTHPDLAENMWTNPNEIAGNGIDDDANGYVDDIHGYDFINNDNDPMDDHNHGTHVSGTIAAVGNNGIGIVGVSWNANIMAVKIFNAAGRTNELTIVNAINYATMMGAPVMNNSWGGGPNSQLIYDAINDANDFKLLFVAAAGNSNNDNDNRAYYPASYDLPNILAVAATDKNDLTASFSSYGRTTVDLGAPGVEILSTLPGNKYASYNGTSMATPHVSGAAALILSQSPTYNASDLKAILMGTVDPIPSLSSITLTGGRLNIASAVNCDSTNQHINIFAPGENAEVLRDTIFKDEESIHVLAYVHNCVSATLNATVTATTDNGDIAGALFDDGLHNDLAANDGIYGGLWDPAELGQATITISSIAATGDAVGERHVFVSQDDDVDKDGLTNLFEQSIGTNHALKDTDGDGLTDYFEVCYDGDCTQYNPYPSGKDANPLAIDTDGDSFSDTDEYFYAGDLTNPNSLPWKQIENTYTLPPEEVTADLYATATSRIGDVNGDNINDYVIGQPYTRSSTFNGYIGGGKVYIHSGKDQTIIHEIDGPADVVGFGGQIAVNGDLNNDGVDDIVITTDYVPTFSPTYSILTYSGSDGRLISRNDLLSNTTDSSYIQMTALNYDRNGDGTNDLLKYQNSSLEIISGVDGSLIYTYPASYGTINLLGDLNNDGIPEISNSIINANTDGKSYNGFVRIVSGSDGAQLYTFNGAESGDWLGISVSNVGDINKDGIDDFGIGSLRAMIFQKLDPGLVTIYSGADASVIYRLEGYTAADWHSFVAPFDLGDDDIPDFMVTARLGDMFPGQYDNSGTIYIYRGSDGSLVKDIHPTNGFYGIPAISLGDINNDSVDDLLYTASYGGGAFTLLTSAQAPIVRSYKQLAGPFVSIEGAYFKDTLKITFDGVPAQGYQVRSNNVVEAIRPVNVTTGPICVTTKVDTACTPMDYIAPPVLFSWTQGPGPFVPMTGINFVGTSSITFNGVAAMGFQVYSQTNVTAITPVDVTSGPICLTTSVGSTCTPTPYIARPIVKSWEQGVGSQVFVNGLNFENASAVTFAGEPAKEFVILDKTRIDAKRPNAAIEGTICVSTPVGKSCSTTNYVF